MDKTSNTNSSTTVPSPPTPTPAAAEAPPLVTEKVAGGAKAGFWMKRMDVVDEDINDSAEQFIKRFRENLLLQRLQSIENYKQMLARGV